MDITDLMIGDWVQVPSLIDNVEHYDAWCKVKQLRDYDLDVVGFKGLKYDEIAPIPLTPEILEKNGFVYNDLPFAQYWEQFGLMLLPCGKGYSINCGLNISMIINSVHELQHALKLCGIKQEIIL